MLNPLPDVISGSAVDNGQFTFLIDLNGAGFLITTVLTFDNFPPLTTQLISSTHIQATISKASYSIATVAVASNPDPGASTSAPFIISLPNAPTLIVNGVNQVRAGSSATYGSVVSGLSNASVNWAVNGVVGGGTAAGTISATGVYVAPSVLPSPNIVTITSSSVLVPSLSASLSVSILNPVPVVANATAVDPGTADLNIDIQGSGFGPESVVSLNGASTPSSFISASDIQLAIAKQSVDFVLGNPNNPPVTVVVTNPDPGSSSAAPVLVSLPIGTQGTSAPAPFQALTGCQNPYEGVPTNDWGLGTSGVYLQLNDNYPLIGTPYYAMNTIIWTSKETGPGQSVLMTGAFTSGSKTARVAVIPPGTKNWHNLVLASANVVATIQQGTTGLSFKVPAQSSPGVYGFEIEDNSAPTIFGIVNVPSLDWAIGAPSLTDPAHALQSQIYDCGAETGGTLRIFGKDLAGSQQIILQSATGYIYPLQPSVDEATSITVDVPSSLPAGPYNLWVGTYPWSATSSPAAQITLFKPQAVQVSNSSCSSLVGDGVTDNSGLLQSCLDANAPMQPGVIASINVGQGAFLLQNGIILHPYELLVGDTPATTQFIGRSLSTPPQAWILAPPHVGVANFSFDAPANPSILSSSDTSGNPLNSGYIYVNNVKVSSDSQFGDPNERMVKLSGPSIEVYNSTFRSYSNQAFDIIRGDGSITSGNTFILNRFTGLALQDSQNQVFENNLAYSELPLNTSNDPHSGGSGLSLSRAFSQYGVSAVVQNIYVGHNTFQDMGSWDQQIITADGGGGAYLGYIAGSTASTVTLAADPTWAWTGDTNPALTSIQVISGPGVGQYSALASYSGRSLQLVTPWKVLPDVTSIVGIISAERNITVAHNTITDCIGATISLGNAFGIVIEDNILTNSGFGIGLGSLPAYGGPAGFGPNAESLIYRNTIAAGRGDRIFPSPGDNNGGIGIYDQYGTIVSGAVVRGNVLPSIQTIYSSNGEYGVNAVLIEQNIADWIDPQGPIPGFLVQDNILPPPGGALPGSQPGPLELPGASRIRHIFLRHLAGFDSAKQEKDHVVTRIARDN
ncbi:MAG TPA: right-handed parallel beta-helix repeat-containing protein [Acidisarcina sp.]